MKLTLPSGVQPAVFKAALADFARVVGSDWVLATDADRDAYLDLYALDETRHVASAAVAPATVEEIRVIVRLANQHRIPLWPISRGKNLCYGGAAPMLRGAVILDLSRMKAISLDAENGTVLVEPGVGFYDLYDYIQQHSLPYWLSVPGNSWGSVAGNALERGVGYTSYGDHSSKICGLEAVLPDGDLVRTGMGAMAGSPGWQLYRNGYGPAWDQMFVQSNFGIVTKLGLWLMPAPESILGLDVELDKPEDIAWAIDALAPLRRDSTLQQSTTISNWLRSAGMLTTRSDWTDRRGPLSNSVIDAIRAKFNTGWWSFNLRLFGHEEVNEAALRIIRARIEAAGKPAAIRPTRWQRGDAPERTPFAGFPITSSLQHAGWPGGRGAHIDFSPVMPMRGDLALAQFRRTYDRFREYGVDYMGSFSLGERHATNINTMLFDKDDKAATGDVAALFERLVADAAALGYGEYRTHLDYMDVVARSYGFNEHALLRLNERVKDALDPNGVIAPGKSGIWPKASRA